MAAEIVAMETPTGVEEDLSVETEVVLVEALVAPNQASLLDVTSVGTHVRFRLNQTEVSQSCAVNVSEETKAAEQVALSHDARLIESPRLEEASTIAETIDQSVDLPQVQLLWAQA
ncbi:MAG TPA: hypothetical protein VJB64_03030 [Patescibacteria group bacterium]|nr:hypothetical protein [Patescibacteria group bacterium]